MVSIRPVRKATPTTTSCGREQCRRQSSGRRRRRAPPSCSVPTSQPYSTTLRLSYSLRRCAPTRRRHVLTGTGLTPAHICIRNGLTPATSALAVAQAEAVAARPRWQPHVRLEVARPPLMQPLREARGRLEYLGHQLAEERKEAAVACVATHCNRLQHAVQHAALRCNRLQHAVQHADATRYNTQCNTLQHAVQHARRGCREPPVALLCGGDAAVRKSRRCKRCGRGGDRPREAHGEM
jgi:hypothetical protein